MCIWSVVFFFVKPVYSTDGMKSHKKNKSTPKKYIRRYFDFSAVTPVDPIVQKVVQQYDSWLFHNAGTVYKEGVLAHQALEHAREGIAQTLHGLPQEIIFTSGATESDNLALYGILRAYKGKKKPHVIVSSIEHSAVYEWVTHMVARGEIEATFIPVDVSGQVDIRALKESIRSETILVSIQYVNSETGVIQPIQDLVRVVKKYRKESQTIYPYVHTDAAQALLYLPIHLDTLGVDLLTLNSAKVYGPHGVGLLVVRRGVFFEPLFYGGNQEYRKRPGTVHVAAIVGFAEAIMIADKRREKDNKKLSEQRAFFLKKIQAFPQIHILGNPETTTSAHIFLYIEKYPSDLLVLELDARGILVSSQSACTIGGGEISRVFSAITGNSDKKELTGTVRITLGRTTSMKDIHACINAFKDIFKKYNAWYTADIS